jgi:hypothetical protein
MSRDEILKMSMEAGFAGWKCDEEKIERFFRAAYEAGAAAEREACAKAAESEPAGMMNCDANGSPSDEYVAKWKVAANIRARGEK